MIKKPRLVLISIILILLILSILFRRKISSLLYFSQNSGDISKQLDLSNGISSTTLNQNTSANSAKAGIINGNFIYKGEYPTEIKPNLSEVSIFTDSQKKELYDKIKQFGGYVIQNPDEFDSWIQLGLFKKEIGDYSGARDAWEFASLIRPKNSLSFENLGELYFHYLHNYPKSEENYLTAIKNKPTDSSNYIILSQLYEYSYTTKADMADKVLIQGSKAVPSPQVGDLYRQLGAYYQRHNQNSEALIWWKKVLALYPNDSQVAAIISSLESK